MKVINHKSNLILLSLILGVTLIYTGLIITAAHVPGVNNSMYKVLVYVPYEREVAESQLGDSHFAKQDYQRALKSYLKADMAASRNNKCALKIKAGDSYYNLASQETDRGTKQRYLQAAVDIYSQCLQLQPGNQLAAMHKAKAKEKLDKLQPKLDTQGNQGGSDSNQQDIRSNPQTSSNGAENSDNNQAEINW